MQWCFLINLHEQDYNPKLSDFGLAKDGPEGDKSHVSTRIMGTYGYAAPEYIMTGTIYLPLTCLALHGKPSSFNTNKPAIL